MKGWWDKECKEKKEVVRRRLREWRRGQEQKYEREKREYEELCKRKKKEENESWLKMAAEVRTEEQIWEIINKERKKRKKINESIEMKE